MSLLNLLGAERTRRLLRSTAPGVERLRDEVERRTFDRRLQIAADEADFDAVSRGGVGAAWDSRGRVPTVASLKGVDAANPIEPIVACEITWGDGTVERFAKIDRDVETHVLHGRLRSIGKIRRAHAVDHTLQRTTTSIELENVDGHFNERLRNRTWMGARVQFRIRTAASTATEPWQPICGPMLIEDFDGLTPTGVRFTLVDAASDVFGKTIMLPTLGDLLPFSFEAAVRASVEIPGDVRLDVTKFRDLSNQGPASWDGKTGHLGAGSPGLGRTSGTLPTGYIARGGGGSIVERRIPMFFGKGGLARPAFAWVKERFLADVTGDEASFASDADGYDRNPVAVIVLGASKRRGWVTPHQWPTAGRSTFSLWAKKQPKSNGGQDVYSTRPDSMVEVFEILHGLGALETGFAGFVNVVEVDSRNSGGEVAAGDTNTWFVAYLTICANRGRMQARGDGYVNAAREALALIQEADAKGELFVEYPYGCEGTGAPPFSGSQTAPDCAAAAIEHLCKYFGAATSRDLDLDALKALASTEAGRLKAAGVIYEDTPTVDVLGQICSTFQIDAFYDRRGRASFKAPGPSYYDLATKIPNARSFRDEYEITRGSFSVRQPKGNERWGVGTVFRFDGVREHLVLAVPAYSQPTQFRWVSSDLGNREIDKTVNVSWVPQPFTGFVGDGQKLERLKRDWATPHRQPRYVSSFATPLLNACAHDLSDYVQLTHYGAPLPVAPFTGWTDRLGRIESIELDLDQLVADVAVVELEDDRDAWVLDDERHWERVVPRSGELIGKTNGSTVVNCVGWNPQERGIVAWDILWIPTSSGTSHHCGIVVASVSSTQIFLSELYGGLTDAAWANFKILRSHFSPPTNDEIPGAYPHGSDMFGRLCDELLTDENGDAGAFVEGGPSPYRFYR